MSVLNSRQICYQFLISKQKSNHHHHHNQFDIGQRCEISPDKRKGSSVHKRLIREPHTIKQYWNLHAKFVKRQQVSGYGPMPMRYGVDKDRLNMQLLWKGLLFLCRYHVPISQKFYACGWENFSFIMSQSLALRMTPQKCRVNKGHINYVTWSPLWGWANRFKTWICRYKRLRLIWIIWWMSVWWCFPYLRKYDNF